MRESSIDCLADQKRTVITLDSVRRIIKDGAVAVEEDRILAVGKTKDLKPRYASDSDIDATGKVILPGLVNTHNHIYQTIMRGLSDDGDRKGREKGYRWDIDLLKGLDKNVCYAAGMLASLEMIKSGITTSQDSHYINFHKDSIDGIAHSIKDSGMKVVLGRGCWDLFGLAPDNLTEDISTILNECRMTSSNWHRKAKNRIKVRLEASLLSQVSDELIISTKELSKKLGLGWSIHIQQPLGSHPMDPRTNDLSMRDYEGRAIEYLKHLDVLGPDSLLIHCTFADNHEIQILSETETPVAHCPCANAWAGRKKVTAVPKMIEEGVKVGLGTDGALTNNSLDMFHAMNFCALIHKVNNGNIRAMTAEKVLEMSTIEASKALMLDKEIGSIEAGKKADLILIDIKGPGLTPNLLPVKNLIYSSISGRNVDTVIIDGEKIMEKRQLKTMEEEKVYEEAEKAAWTLLYNSSHLTRDPKYLERGGWKLI